MYDVSISKLRAFERTVRLGGVQAAADALGLTQSAVSQRIRELERTLGRKVFDRSSRSLKMTPDGSALLFYTDELLKLSEELSLRLTTGDPLQGVLRLGVSSSFAALCMDQLMRELGQRFDSLRFALVVGDSNILSEMLNNLKLDIAVTSEHKMAAHIHRKKLGINQHGWFASASTKITGMPLTPEKLAAHHVIVTPMAAFHNLTVTQWFREAKIVPERLSTCNDLAATVAMVKSGTGIAYLPIRMMDKLLRDNLVQEISVLSPLPGYEVSVCYQVNELGPGLQVVVNVIERIAEKNRLYS